ncbi:Endonuclease III-like protein 1 [Pseudolycoriella hygida]|uniref:Endonuclease III homolog n=1 Tax=Pseudolycoriella hygida TaxID=35572 RepID=A0A9Q0MIJ6_9DIPT|nr:Endonuclease III-like protein 1 [Pseudolycoriella hygida]
MLKIFRYAMSKRKPTLAKLNPKLINECVEDGNNKTVATNSINTSAYFSPKKTRNKIKIEYEVFPKKSETKAVSDISKKTKSEPITTKETDETDSKNLSETDSKKPKWEPKNWRQTLENIRKMRKDQIAPVDAMGCDKCHDENADEKTQRYHILIALMLSSQTKDQTNFEAMKRLKAHGLTPENIVQSDANVLEKLINPVSFYKNKTKHIQKASQILIDQYDSDIPNTLEGLMKLPGVGPKMAHICMNSAWNIVTGIGVDVHVHRISNRLKWVPKATKEPEKTRLELEKWLPFEYWTDVNNQLVGFGQTICTPTNPKCSQCLNTECPSRNVKK